MSTLRRLTIENVGLIARAEVTLGDGFTVFTGETGSGKTMLLGALALALGARAGAESIRRGAERARVTLEIEPDDALRAAAAAAGIALADDDDVIASRELLPGGRSQARINGVPVSAGQLRELIGALVDVVGQHEAQRLLEPAYALELLDRFGGGDALAARADVERLHADERRLATALDAARADGGRAAARLELARAALAEIDAVAPQPGEDEVLRARRDRLAGAERIAAALAAAQRALEDDGGGVDALGAAAGALAALERFGAEYAALAGDAAALQSETNALAARIARAAADVEAGPAELEAVGARLDELARLARRYGGSLDALAAARAAFEETILADEGRDERTAAFEAEIVRTRAALAQRAAALSALRAAAAGALEAEVAAELSALAMPAARLRVALESAGAIGPSGAERAELRFAANAGEPERALARVASGGELSRVLLALVVVLADRRERTALVFDEVDAGIGGATATAVAQRLARLAEDGQVILVTHLAQIASVASAHAVLRKRDDGDATTVDVLPLASAERPAEIARMLSGETSGVSLEHAAALLARG